MTNSFELDKEIKEKLLAKSKKRGVEPSELLNEYVSEGLRNDAGKRGRSIDYLIEHYPLLDDWEASQRRGYTHEELNELLEEISDPNAKPFRLNHEVWGIEIDENIEGETVEKGASK